jgi:acetyltransferase-like isoleucine patch superfamily enzyme
MNDPSARWTEGDLPAQVVGGPRTVITSRHAFARFRAKHPSALQLGSDCRMDGVHFALGEVADVHIGDHCYFTDVVLLCELRIEIGRFVTIGWNTTIADSDFHPLDPALRQQDAIACSPASRGLRRPTLVNQPVVIEDFVWIGPAATVLKGVRLGRGCLVEPGALVTRDVPARARVLGNPAQVVGEV